jgi:hypothetical protein
MGIRPQNSTMSYSFLTPHQSDEKQVFAMGVHSIEKRQLSAKVMLAKIRSIFENIPEPPRDSRGLKSEISLSEV